MERYFAWKQRFVRSNGATVAFARYIGVCENRHDARFVVSRRRVNLADYRMSMRGHHRPGVQEVGESSTQVIDIQRFACDMSACAFVRQPGGFHTECSH